MGSRLEANSSAVRKRIEEHKFEDEGGEEYGASKFGGFPEYFRRKKIKLQNLDAEIRSTSTANPPIFRGIVAHVNGYTQPSLNDLHALIVSYGGGFMQYLGGKTTVTHIIASNLTPKKKVEFSRYRIVKPAWIVDSINAGKLLPWNAYKVVDEGVGQQVLGFDNGNIVSQVSRHQAGYRDQTDKSWYTEQVSSAAKRLNEASSVAPNSSAQSGSEKDAGNELESVELNPHDERVSRCGTPVEDISKYADVFDTTIDKYKNQAKRSSDDASGHARTVKPDESTLQSEDEVLLASSGFPQENNLEPLERTATHGADEAPGDLPCIAEPFPTLAERDPAVISPRQPALMSPSHSTAYSKHEVSAEEHNAMLLADPKVWKSTVVNPGFLKQYYEESRLHHLSTWKADLKSKLQALAAEKSSSQKARQKRVSGARRYVLHVDFDSFFAAVSLKKFPQYVDKPVVVAHGGGSGSEIASCNYPARKFGIKNGMWMKNAQKMCPELKVLPYDFKAYEEASRQFYEAIIDTGGIVQSVSVDEALVDISVICTEAGGHNGVGIHEGSIWREQAKADEIGQKVRDRVQATTGCAVSVGIGGNILLAKVALRKAKPAGQYQIKPEEVLHFVGNLTVQELPGVAYSIGGKLEEIGVKYVKDIRELTKDRLMSTLGPKTGEKIWDYARGIDKIEVGEQVIRKSVSAEVNWGIRFVRHEQADEFVQSLCEELHKRLLTEKVKGRQLTMKIMRRAADAPLDPPKHLGHGKCDTFNKSIMLGVATNDKDILSREAISIMRGWGFSPGELRGIGVQMTRLEPLKGSVESPTPSSQRLLQFKTPGSVGNRVAKADAIDEVASPKKLRGLPQHPAAGLASDISPSGKRRASLNTLGTQFVLPSQVDPDVLAELPPDIRSKLELKVPSHSADRPGPASPTPKSRSISPGAPSDLLPNHSQLDLETLEALPEDVRAEVLAFYQSSPRKANAQTRLPQSPHKSRLINVKKHTTPTKTEKRAGLLFRGKPNPNHSTLTQSNFVAKDSVHEPKPDDNNEMGSEEIPDDFLSALPPDIRSEVVAQARRDRLHRRGGIDLSNAKKSKKPRGQAMSVGQRKLQLQPRPPKPTFTTARLTELPEVRSSLATWFEEFREEGPYPEDVDVLVTYLTRVVREEHDMAKAVSITKWLWWMIENPGDGLSETHESLGTQAWRLVAMRVQEGVQRAVKERGLGAVEF
ncbi:MAG: hypothetical protein Q9191_003858 [Dirinaria sp. TL-2023a]